MTPLLTKALFAALIFVGVSCYANLMTMRIVAVKCVFKVCVCETREKMEAGDKIVSSATQVRGTNDWCTVSKASMARAGYVYDPFVAMFVDEEKRRSPLIHHGYYARHEVLEMCISGAKSVETLAGALYQVLSLGGGFDSRFFSMASTGTRINTNLRYFEVDFAEVIERKRKIIGSHPAAVKLAEGRLNLCAADLEDLTGVKAALDNAGFVWDRPTIVIAECSIVYMPLDSVKPLLMWLATVLKQAVFVLYEQIHPDDAFGGMMDRHFREGGSPLRTLHAYKDLESQYRRLLEAGWEYARVADVAYLYDNFVPVEEKHRISCLERFDEYEEFYSKCCHYVLAVAGKGKIGLEMMTHALPVYQFPAPPKSDDEPKVDLDFTVTVTATAELPSRRCGHGAVILPIPTGYSLVLGGYGWPSQPLSAHSRLRNYEVFDECLNHVDGVRLGVPMSQKGFRPELDRMHATVISVPMSIRVMVMGGRKSPFDPHEDMLSLRLNPVDKVLVCHMISTDSVCRRWRHTATWVSLPDPLPHGGIFVHGGRGGSGVLGDAWIFALNGGKWTKLTPWPDRICPPARHSHAIATLPTSTGELFDVYISGGIGYEHTVLGDLWHYDVLESTWREVPLKGFRNRFGHRMQSWKGLLMSVGGVSSNSEFFPGVMLIDVTLGVCREVSIAFSGPWPNFFWGHQCLWDDEGRRTLDDENTTTVRVIGGGGTCFSFGTCCNGKVLELDITLKEPAGEVIANIEEPC